MQESIVHHSGPFEPSHSSDAPLYGQVMAWLLQVIESDFSHDQRFFSERELIEKLRVSQPTVRRAMQELVSRGLLRRHVGKGTFVQKYPPTRLVGIISPGYRSPVLMDHINAVAEACGDYNCNLRVHHVQKGESARDFAREFKSNPYEERIILIGHSEEDSWVLFDELDHRGFRSVCAAPFLSNYPGSSVAIDTEAGVRIAFDHLMSLGHRRVAFIINEPVDLPYVKIRLEAIRQEVAARGLDECVFIDCQTPRWASSFDAAFSAMDQVCALQSRPTAIVPLSGIGAWAVLRFAVKHNLRLPECFSVFAFDDLEGAQYLYPALSGLSVERSLQAKSLLDILWSEDASVRRVMLSPHLVARESTIPVVRSL